jgi:hypothetical protein
MVLALYLCEVVPSTYGVPKHWLFCLKKYKKSNRLVRFMYGKKDNFSGDSDDTKNNDEDEDSR